MTDTNLWRNEERNRFIWNNLVEDRDGLLRWMPGVLDSRGIPKGSWEEVGVEEGYGWACKLCDWKLVNLDVERSLVYHFLEYHEEVVALWFLRGGSSFDEC